MRADSHVFRCVVFLFAVVHPSNVQRLYYERVVFGDLYVVQPCLAKLMELIHVVSMDSSPQPNVAASDAPDGKGTDNSFRFSVSAEATWSRPDEYRFFLHTTIVKNKP